MSEPNPPDAAPQFNSRRKHSRKHRSPGERALWQIGVAAAPPAAVIGLAMSVFGFFEPALAVIPLMRATSYLLLAVCAASLVLIFIDVRPGSTRLRRAKVWLAIGLAAITIPALFYVDRRAQRIVGNYVPPALGPSNMDAPPSER